METQSDQMIRVVALANLRAMCERISGTSHQFYIVKVSRSRVHVEYSNPDEYGNEHPMAAMFPCFPRGDNSTSGFWANPNVVLQCLHVTGDKQERWNGEGWQAFQPLLDCPTLWRVPACDGRQDGTTCDNPECSHAPRWETHHEINQRLNATPINRVDNCTVCDLPIAYEARCGACGWSERLTNAGASKSHADAVLYFESAHTDCNPFITEVGHTIERKPDVTVRAITRAEVQS